MATPPPSPRISHLSWGRVQVEGHGEFKDVKLYPGGARTWDWRETGTDHEGGIRPADADELLDHGARVVVLTRGMLGRLRVPARTVEALESRGAEVHVLGTEAAAECYNRLRESGPVGALIHSTC